MKIAGFVALSSVFAFVVIACGDDDVATTAGASDASSSTPSDSSATVDSSTQGKDSGSSGSDDGGAPTDSSAQNNYDAAACGYTTSCLPDAGAGPIDAGTLSGDTTPSGGNVITLSGHSSEWLTLLVTENDESPIGRALTLSAILSAPASVNYDLYLYRQTDGSTTPECTTVAGSSTEPAGKSDGVALSWGEGAVSNASDDTETITIRVQRISGECDTADSWTLTLTGNTGS